MSHRFEIVSPVDDRVYASRDYAGVREIQAAADRAREAFIKWRAMPVVERAACIRKFLVAMERRRESLAEAVTWQMGRPLWQADEVGRMRADCEALIKAASAVTEPVSVPASPGVTRYVRREPLGLCLSISAWNYPVAMASYLVVAPLLAGNVVIYKHAVQTALIAEMIEEAFMEAGLPPGVFQALHMKHEDVAVLLKSGRVNKVHFIGSTAGGKQVQQAAARSPLFLKTCLELGGKDPAYLRADVDPEKVVPELIEGAFGNAGQSCCSVERIYVHDSIYERFIEAYVAAVAEQVTLGHPLEGQPFIGPLSSARAAQQVRAQIAEALSAGARNLLPSGRFDCPGEAYVEPSILVDVNHDMRVMTEETFGPSVAIMKVSGDDEALALMNDSIYGLTASVWTQDIDVYTRLADSLQAGTVYMNRCDHADVTLPWGGYKQSGIGRFNGGEMGFEDMTQMKSCHVRTEW